MSVVAARAGVCERAADGTAAPVQIPYFRKYGMSVAEAAWTMFGKDTDGSLRQWEVPESLGITKTKSYNPLETPERYKIKMHPFYKRIAF